MALTITNEPSTSDIHTCYRPYVYRVTSNNSNIAKIQCEIYIAGIYRKTIVLDPDINSTNIFTLDISSHIRDDMSYDTPSLTSQLITLTQAGATSINIVTAIFNEVTLTSGVLTVEATDYTSNSPWVTPIVLQHEENQNLTSYYTDATSKPFLTNIPTSQYIFRGESIRLGFLLTASQCRIKVYQYQGTTLLGSTSTSNTSISKRGYTRINTAYLSSLCDRIIIELTNTSGTQISEQREYKILENKCEDALRVWFLNKFSDFDQFTFDGQYTEDADISRSTYNKVLPTTFIVPYRGESVFNVDTAEKYSIVSRPVTREETRWLRQLFTSPEVYIEKDSVIIPIVVTNEGFNTDNLDLGKPIKLSFRKSNKPIIQIN